FMLRKMRRRKAPVNKQSLRRTGGERPLYGGPSRIRTCGLRIRSPTLYPSELWALTTMMAEREGFEPSIQLWAVYWFSKPAPSASRPPLHFPDLACDPAGGSAAGKRRLLDHAPLRVKARHAERLAECRQAALLARSAPPR